MQRCISFWRQCFGSEQPGRRPCQLILNIRTSFDLGLSRESKNWLNHAGIRTDLRQEVFDGESKACRQMIDKFWVLWPTLRNWSSDISGNFQAKEVSRDDSMVVMLRFCCTSHPSPFFEARGKVWINEIHRLPGRRKPWNILRGCPYNKSIHKVVF
jgi:hypothetical protein